MACDSLTIITVGQVIVTATFVYKYMVLSLELSGG